MKRARSALTMKLLAVGVAVAVAGCGDSGLGPDQGRVHFVLSSGTTATGVSTPQTISDVPTLNSADATVPTTRSADGWDGEKRDYSFFSTANVTFSSILARNASGELVNVEMDLPTTVDVVAMDRGSQVSLPDGALAAGTYDQLVVVMTQVNGVAKDSTQISLTPPGGGWTAIVPICPFTVDQGASTTVSLQFMLRQAFSWNGTRFRFQPQFQCESNSSTSSTGG